MPGVDGSKERLHVYCGGHSHTDCLLVFFSFGVGGDKGREPKIIRRAWCWTSTTLKIATETANKGQGNQNARYACFIADNRYSYNSDIRLYTITGTSVRVASW